ncbi:hypothetical protein NST94_04425 [Paenibacillus sp. FSL H8-0282]|jgi:hypothetical protein|uniref:hypothetical protein n=1 Tax=Paenibacillus TaxID=44249 RepID=UPI0011157912|nr:hypothetical protein [Paenibacillus odorifer]
MRYYCVEMGGTVKCGTLRWPGSFGCECTAPLRWIVQICSWWSPCENLLMVDSMGNLAHVGTPCGNLPALDSMWESAHVGTPCGNLPMLDSMWKSAHDGDSIVQLSSVQYE